MPKIQVGRIGGGGAKAAERQKLRASAEQILEDSDLKELFNMVGAKGEETESAEALLKGLLAENAADYLIKANRVKRKRGLRQLGPAALIIAARQ